MELGIAAADTKSQSVASVCKLATTLEHLWLVIKPCRSVIVLFFCLIHSIRKAFRIRMSSSCRQQKMIAQCQIITRPPRDSRRHLSLQCPTSATWCVPGSSVGAPPACGPTTRRGRGRSGPASPPGCGGSGRRAHVAPQPPPPQGIRKMQWEPSNHFFFFCARNAASECGRGAKIT